MGSGFGVTFTEDAAAFLERAGEWLSKDPVTATVVTSNAQRNAVAAACGEAPRDIPYRWFATVDGPAGEVAGVAMRTAAFAPYPPYVLGMPDAAAVALADALVDRGEVVDGINGMLPATRVAADGIAGRTGRVVRDGIHSRLFELGDLVEPRPAAGRLRAVRPDEATFALKWIRQFFADADEQAGRAPGSGHGATDYPLEAVENRIREGMLWFWVDGDDRPRHLTGANPPAYGVSRIGPVFTPAEHRGRGYASATVAEVSRLLLDQGARVTLFTDQANPASNRIYVALGYRPVVDTIELFID